MRQNIYIRNLSRFDIDGKVIIKIVSKALRAEKIRGIISMEVVFVGEKRMREINNLYRGRDETTDVLSFGAGGNLISFPEDGKFFGEIFLCPSFIIKKAKKEGLAFNKELAHVLIHGVLHLLGWEHEDGIRGSRKMHAKEEEIMSGL